MNNRLWNSDTFDDDQNDFSEFYIVKMNDDFIAYYYTYEEVFVGDYGSVHWIGPELESVTEA